MVDPTSLYIGSGFVSEATLTLLRPLPPHPRVLEEFDGMPVLFSRIIYVLMTIRRNEVFYTEHYVDVIAESFNSGMNVIRS